MLLNPCVTQNNEYSFLIKDNTTQQMYTESGVDLSTVTAASLRFKNLYDDEEYTINILTDWEYLIGDGLTINIIDFPNRKMGEWEYFPDWVYEISVIYTYNGTQYTKKQTVGFKFLISEVVFQQLMQEDWKKTLACGCNCSKVSLSARKFNYIKSLEYAMENCLVDEYTEMLQALYKLANQTHVFS